MDSTQRLVLSSWRSASFAVGDRGLVWYGSAVLGAVAVLSLMMLDLWLFVMFLVGSASAALGYSASTLSLIRRSRLCRSAASDRDEGVGAAVLAGVARGLEPDVVMSARRMVEESTDDRWLVALAHHRLDGVPASGASGRSAPVLVLGPLSAAVIAAAAGSVTQHRGWALTMVGAAAVGAAAHAAFVSRSTHGARVLASLALSRPAPREDSRGCPVPVSGRGWEEPVLVGVRAWCGTHLAVLVIVTGAAMQL